MNQATVSIVAWFLYGLPKKLVFVPIASAMAGGHRDCPVIASVYSMARDTASCF